MKKTNFLLAMLVLIMFRANAQPPTTATAPTKAAADVISIFSDAYTNISGTDFNPNWGQGTQVSDTVVSGDNIKKYGNLDYQGTNLGSRVNASSMESIHFDIWTPNATQIRIFMVNEGNTGGPAEQGVTLTLTQNGWNTVDIPMSSYHASIISSISQFKIEYPGFAYHNSPYIFYLDNIYFWKSANIPTISGFSFPTKFTNDAPFQITAPTSTSGGAFTYTSGNTNVATIVGDTVTIVGAGTSVITANQAADGSFSAASTTATLTVTFAPPSTNPTAPTHLQANVISVFSDAYTNVSGTNFYPNWGQSTTHLDMTVSGNTIKRYDNLNYQGIEFVANQNVSSMENLHFDVWTPNCSSLDFYLINTNPQVERKVTVNPTLSGWNSFDIPFSSFSGIDFTKVFQIKLVGNNGSTIYLDNIYFWRSASSPIITGFSVPAKNLGDAAFNLTAPTSNSNGAFTYTSSNTSVATVSGSTVTIVGIGSTTITASQAADAPYTAGSTNAILVVTYPPPPTAAPVPTKDAADVLSVFSDTYTNISGTDFYPNWGQSTVVSNISIGGNTTKSYQSLNYQGVQFAGAVDASQMTELHLDIWTPNCTAFEVFLINGVNMEQSVTLNPTASGWNSFDISLSQYTTINKASIIQFKLVGTPFGSSQVFLDNIYFWKATPVTLGSFTVPAKQVGDAAFALTAPSSNSAGAFTYTSSNTNVATISGNMVTITGAGTSTITASQAANGAYGSASATASLVVTLPPLPPAPITAASTPTKPQANVISLFSDAYSNVAGTDFFPNWGQSTQVEDTMIESNTTKKYTNLNYQGIQFAGTIDASEALYLHADIWTSTCTAFQIFLINTATGAEVPYTLNPTLGGWNSYDIALTNYPSSIVNHVNQIKLVGTPFGSSKVYMDNLYFWANSCINHVAAPSVSITSDANNVCPGTSITITATPTDGGTAPNYNFKVNGSSVQNGSSNTYTSTSLANSNSVTCVISRTDGCANDGNSNSVTIVIKAAPSVAQITNGISAITAASLCTLTSASKYYSATPYGTWSSSNPSVASVTGGSQAGIVTANANGTATVRYSVAATNGCISSSSLLVTVAPQSAPAAISGTNSICVNATTALSSTAPVGTTGVWSSSSNRGIISVGGVYTGQNAGTGEARYTVTNTTTGCKAFAAYAITVNSIPSVPTITYAPGTVGNPQAGAPTGGFCIGKKFSVVGVPTGGHWTYTNGAVTTIFDSLVSANNWWGTVKILGAGTGSIKYTYTSAAGCSNSRTMSGNGVTCASRGVNINSTNTQSEITSFTMFPNPAKNAISINMDKVNGDGQIIINDLYGKRVKTQTLSLGSNNIDVSNLSKGFYLVSVLTNEGTQSKKLIVE